MVGRANKLYSEEKFWDAIQLLEGLLGRAEGKALARVRVLLAQCYLKNPNWVRRAEEQAQLVLAKDSNHVDANYLLGTIYKNGGLKTRALTYLRKVVELKPDHDQAQHDLLEMQPSDSTPAPSEGGGGLLKKLFGRS
jgi:tetratricopeptide (TPR) repeat protein